MILMMFLKGRVARPPGGFLLVFVRRVSPPKNSNFTTKPLLIQNPKGIANLSNIRRTYV